MYRHFTKNLTATFISDGIKKERDVEYKSNTPPLFTKVRKNTYRLQEYTPCLSGCHSTYVETKTAPKGVEKMDVFYPHTRTLNRMKDEIGIRPTKNIFGQSTGEKINIVFEAFEKMMDEAALATDQGGAINYNHMLNILNDGAMKYD